MKPGTIVVCLKTDVQESLLHLIKWIPVMDEKTPYMVRTIGVCPVYKEEFVTFEEGTIGIQHNGEELGFPISRVREILPPGEISEEIKEVLEQENLVRN